MVDLEEPDKGRAWVVAISACIINLILSGISRMVSILYVAIIDIYGVTRGEATLPFTVRNSVRSLSGPVVGIIGVRFGIRNLTLFGGVLAFVGVTLCYLAPNVIWLTVFWGGIHGLGFALSNTLFQVVVNQYFQKYRATASGIALSGACVGSFVFPVLIEWILDTFGLSGGFLILGGIVMHVLPPALLMASPQWVEHPEAYARLWSLQNSSTTPEETTTNTSAVETNSEEHKIDKDLKTQKKVYKSVAMSNHPVESIGVSKASSDHNRGMRKGLIFDHSEECKKKGRHSASSIATKDEFGVFSMSCRIKKEIPEDQSRLLQTPSRKKHPPSILQMLKSMVGLYTIPVYVLISVCMCQYVIIFIPMLTVIVDYGTDKGFPESYGKYLINAMAVGDMIGRLGFGWVTDKKLMTLPIFMFYVLALQGVFVSVLPIASSLPSFVTVLVLYSVAAGCLLVIFPVLVFHYIDINLQSVAIANVGLLAGIISFGIPPMIEKFRDNLGSYDGMFYLTGVISIICGSLWLLAPIAEKCGCTKKPQNASQFETEEGVNGSNSNVTKEGIKEDENTVDLKYQ